jgi:hypothetical protein
LPGRVKTFRFSKILATTSHKAAIEGWFKPNAVCEKEERYNALVGLLKQRDDGYVVGVG